MADSAWWRSAVVYQIYPRSFCDRSGDGIGDLDGIRAHLDHLAWLGVDALWLSPIYPSPMADFGYDVADHTDVDPRFGDLETFDALVAEAHARGLRVLLDWVPNHTSDQHPWFLESRRARDAATRDWYVWRDPRPDGGPPNDWRAAFDPTRPAWTWDEATAQWYLHHFLPQQPDLDWHCPDVEAAMHDVLRFWLARGVDGFRADVVHMIGKDPALPDDPPELAGLPRPGFHYEPACLHPLLRRIRGVLDAHGDGPDDARVMVGEVNLADHDAVAACARPDELHLAFDFALLQSPWDAEAWRRAIEGVTAACAAQGAWPAWVLGNHDEPRLRTRYGGSEARARAAAVAVLTLPGTAFVYAGDELGLEDARVDAARAVDPGGRDGCRAPIPWEPGGGWAGEPWLPWPPQAAERAVSVQRHHAGSTLRLHHRALELRRRLPALGPASPMRLRDVAEGVLAVERGDGAALSLTGFADAPAHVDVGPGWQVALATDGQGEGAAFDGQLGADRTVVLVPR